VISATHLARSLVRQLLELGITDFVLSPGSRNAPLSIALYEASQAGLADLHVRIDERGAAFFALGISKVSQTYVAVICTSGTAAANFHPAALEARHSNNKLLLITADRPARLRKTGGNQTTEQWNLYPHIPSHDIAEIIDIGKILKDGPVHLNIQFDEPLLPSDDLNWLAGFTPSIKEESSSSFEKEIEIIGTGVLVIGHDCGGFSKTEVSIFAKSLGWPIIAEDPLSFVNSVAHASIFLIDKKVQALLHSTAVIVIGRITLSRSINSYIQSSAHITVIDPRINTVDSLRTADTILYSLPRVKRLDDPDDAWLKLWRDISALTHHVILNQREWSEQAAITTITSHLPAGSALFIGSSRPIRDIEEFALPVKDIDVYGNRGLAGIDGNISTAFGISTRYQRSYAIFGDLTFLHDISALVNLPPVNLTIFVVDNNGGGIFSTLPQARVAGFEMVFGTPPNADIARIVRGFGIPAEKVKSSADIEKIIAHQGDGIEVVVLEVPDRETNAARLSQIYQSVSKAVRIGNNLD
jgi:2-succinyl-5-enolpyruvyl-6-hydroxy-3-cyclohexene-1-carboxylate synthase